MVVLLVVLVVVLEVLGIVFQIVAEVVLLVVLVVDSDLAVLSWMTVVQAEVIQEVGKNFLLVVGLLAELFQSESDFLDFPV